MKIKLAADLVKAYFKGDKKKCQISTPENEKIGYCNKNFMDNPKDNINCKVKSQFYYF